MVRSYFFVEFGSEVLATFIKDPENSVISIDEINNVAHPRAGMFGIFKINFLWPIV